MSLVLVTGSTDGIGLETARQLLAAGHDVVAHARSDARAEDVRAALPGLRDVLVGDLASLARTRAVGEAAAALGRYDAVVHNAGVGGESDRRVTEDGLERIFQVNTVAPYLLTALVPVPAASSTSPPASRSAAGCTWTTCSGSGARGTGCRPTPTASSTTSSSRSRWRGSGPTSGPPPSTPAGSAPGWAARRPPTTCPTVPRPRCGWPPARTRRPG